MEQALVGALLRKPDLLAEVELLTFPDFENTIAGSVYFSIRQTWEARSLVDYYTILKKHPQHGDWLSEADSVGGMISLHQAQHYAKQIADEARKRRIMGELAKLGPEMQVLTSADLISRLVEIQDKHTKAEAGVVDVADIMHELDNTPVTPTMPTGFEFFERKMIRYRPGHLWIIGGHTSVGKTSILVEMSRRAIGHNLRVAIFSTEMSRGEMVYRFLANFCGINAQVIEHGAHSSLQGKINAAREWLRKTPLRIYDKLTDIQQIATECRRLKLQGGIDLVFVDFLQNCRWTGGKNEYAEQREIARTVQAIPKDAGCCLVGMSQIALSEAREDSGVIAFKGAGDYGDAVDVGIMLKRDKTDNQKIFVDVRKCRYGAKPKQILRFNDSWTGLDEVSDPLNQ